MPIEFPCPQCNQQLRTPDGTGGRRAKCPQCGMIVSVPVPGAEENPDTASRPGRRGDAPEPVGRGDIEDTIDWPAADEPAVNPFAPPASSRDVPAGPEAGVRHGPPWERDGYSVRSFWNTALGVLASPGDMFSEMRRHGGLGGPLLFALVGGMIGAVAFAAMCAMLVPLLTIAGGPNAGVDPATLVVPLFVAIAQILVAGFVNVLVSIFVGSALIHLALLFLGGANYPYEATFRAISYSHGSVGLVQLIPCMGPLIGLVLYSVAVIIGVAEMQEISGVKAAAALFLPVLFCAGLCVVPIAALMFFLGVVPALFG